MTHPLAEVINGEIIKFQGQLNGLLFERTPSHVLNFLVEKINVGNDISVKHAVATERLESHYLRTAIKTLIDALRTSDPILHARAIQIGKECLQLEEDKDRLFGTLTQGEGKL